MAKTKNTLKAEKISFLSSNSRRCGIVGKLNKQTVTGAVHNSSDCWQVCQSKRLSTCQGYVVKVKDFVHITRSNCLATNFEGSSGGTAETHKHKARRLVVCVCVSALADTTAVVRVNITPDNCDTLIPIIAMSYK